MLTCCMRYVILRFRQTCQRVFTLKHGVSLRLSCMLLSINMLRHCPVRKNFNGIMSRIRPCNVFVSLVASFGGFVWGFDAAVISGVAPFLKQYFVFNGTQGDLKLGLAVSALGWGVLAGMAVSGLLSRRFGARMIGARMIFIVITGVFALAALMSALATSFPVFVAWRVLGGIAAGAAILIAPEYLEEVSPSNRRGSLVSLSQLMIVAGMAAAFFSNRLLLDVGENNWRWMLGGEALLAAAS